MDSGVTGSALSVAVVGGRTEDDGPRTGSARLSFRGGSKRVSSWGESSLIEAAAAAASAAASSFRLARRAFAKTALAGSSSSSCLP